MSTRRDTTIVPHHQGPVGRAQTVARALDEAITLPGTGFRVGLDPVIGILPVAGDTVAAVGALYIVVQGMRVGVPRRTLVTMLLLVALDTVVGAVPILGSVFDAALKVNTRNAATVRAHASTVTC